MTPERWQQIDRLLSAAFDLAPEKRAQFLFEVCGSDEELLKELQALLSSDDSAGSFIETSTEPLTIPPSPVSSGELIGPYKILSLLGRGGMGEVYLAEDTRLQRKVAIKTLRIDFINNANMRIRFQREARAISLFSHPNICSIYDVGNYHGLDYLVMEYVEGRNLSDFIQKASLPVKTLMDLAVAIADGLATAHRAGLIHRDLKPGNVMLSHNGQVKILDFGLAKLGKRLDSEGQETVSESLTQAGTIQGTVAYMSPEQAAGKPIDFRSDQFSFGVMLYEMATGRKPFTRESAAQTLAAIIEEDPAPVSALNPKTPSPLRWIIERCLAKDPRERYESTTDLYNQLRDLREHRLETASQTISANGSRIPSTTIAVIAIAILAIVLLFPLRERFIAKPQMKPIDSVAVLPLKNLSGDPDQEYFADGMTEELITALARIEALRVISRTSVMEYKTAKKQLPQIARELNVDAIVEGSVMKDGNRVRITAQLIEASSDRNLWAESYERDLSDILALQNDVAKSIAQQIQIKLTPQDQARLSNSPTVNPDAYQAYLRGLEYSYHAEVSEQNTRLAIQMFERAVALDPEFALAYTELCIAHSFMVHYGYDTSEDRLRMALSSVNRAFAIQPHLPQDHIALGYYHYWGRKDYEQALKEFTVALENLPNNTNALLGSALVERRRGDFQRSIEHIKRVLELDPKSAQVPGDLADTYRIIRKYAEAEQYYKRALALAPDNPDPYYHIAFLDWRWLGRTKEARAILESMPKYTRPSFVDWIWFWQEIYERDYSAALKRLASIPDFIFKEVNIFVPASQLEGVAYELSNQREKARASFNTARLFLEDELRKRPQHPGIHSSLGIVYAGLGRKSEAIKEAKLAVELYPVSKDAFEGAELVQNLAVVYVMSGEYDAAFDRIENLLSIPNNFSVPLLQLDPRWDPLRNHPRYAQLLNKHSQ